MDRFLLFFAIAFVSLWLIIASALLKLFYPSQKNRRGKILVVAAFLSLGMPLFILAFVHTSTTVAIAYLSVVAWFYFIWPILFYYSEGFILTKHQTLSTISRYYRMKCQEVSECVVLENIDIYIRNIPEELVRSIDNDQLMLTWIGLQRTTA